MDSQHRHDLEENDLRAFISHFGEWWGKHGTKFLAVAALLLLSVVAVRVFAYRNTTALETAWNDLADTQTPAGFRDVAARYDLPAVQAQAYLRAGDTLLKEVIRPQKSLDAPSAEAPATSPDKKLEDAAFMYQQVIDGTYDPIFKLNARLGLAAVDEQRGQWDNARRQYEQLIDDASPSTRIQALAKARLAALPQLSKPVIFAPDAELKAEENAATGGDDATIIDASKLNVPFDAAQPGSDAVPSDGAVEPSDDGSNPTDAAAPSDATAPADASPAEAAPSDAKPSSP